MADSHARLSPSAAERWLVCTASVRMEHSVAVPSGSNIYADEGTRAHTRAEIEAAGTFGLITEEEYDRRLAEWELDTPEEEHRDMTQYAKMYVAFLAELLEEEPHSQIMLEQLVDTGVPGSWGTADAVIVSPVHVRVVDYKYGAGIRVDAYENPQLMLYGVGALDMFGDVLGDTEEVRVSIFQPRMENVSHFTISARKLRRWRDKYVIPLAAEANGEHGRFNPTETACKWCPARRECKPRMMKFVKMDFGDPDLMDPDDIAEALERIPAIRDWCNDIEDGALDKIYSQRVPIPGWKAVRSAGRRRIEDHEAAIRKLVKAGFKRAEVSVVKTRTLGELESIVGKEDLPKILKNLIVKPEGSVSLVTEKDKRPAVSPITEAQKDFSGETGEGK